MDYQEYIKSELLILIPVLYFIGMALKKSKLSDKWIPIMLGIIAVALAAIWIFVTGEFQNAREVVRALFTSVTQGVLLAGASVYANQLYLQANKEE